MPRAGPWSAAGAQGSAVDACLRCAFECTLSRTLWRLNAEPLPIFSTQVWTSEISQFGRRKACQVAAVGGMQKALLARANHAKSVLPNRREALWVAAGSLTTCLVLPSPAWSLGQLDELLQARQPQKGNCATCKQTKVAFVLAASTRSDAVQSIQAGTCDAAACS